MRSEWLRKPQTETAVVFVHGLLSSGESCWQHSNGNYWPRLLENEAALAPLGIYVFSYQTGIFSGSYRLSDVVDAFKEQLGLDGLNDLKRLIFVCHSMGGIVARKYLVERAPELIESRKEIALFLVASPSLGSSYANWFAPLAQFLRHKQADALRFVRENSWLNDLDKEFLNLKESGRLKIKGKEVIEDKLVVFRLPWGRQIVEPFSGARYFGEPLKIPGSDHFSIAKPEDGNAIHHRVLVDFIKNVLASSEPPAEVNPGKFSDLCSEVVKGEQAKKVRFWLANDDAYAKVQPIFRKRVDPLMGRKPVSALTEEEYECIDELDYFLRLLVDLIQLGKGREEVLLKSVGYWIDQVNSVARFEVSVYASAHFVEISEFQIAHRSLQPKDTTVPVAIEKAIPPSVFVYLPTHLHRYLPEHIDGGEIHLHALTVQEVVEQLILISPKIEVHLGNGTGEIARFVNIYVNDEDIRYLSGMKTTLTEGCAVTIVPNISGGS